MFYDYPVRRKFTTPINTEFGGCILKYEQNVMRDTLLMIQNYSVPGYLEQRIQDFLREHLHYDGNKSLIIRELLKNPNALIDRIWNNINKNRVSIYDGITIRDEDVGNERLPFSVVTMLLGEKFGVKGPNDLLDNYTLEQYEWMLEGLRFWNYNHDKKLAIYNKKAMAIKYNDKEKNRKLMEYARRGPTKEFLAEYKAKNG